MKKLILITLFVAFFSATFAQNASENVQTSKMELPIKSAILQREIDGQKIFSTFYYSKFHEIEGYFYFVNEMQDEKGVRYENVKKVPKENVYMINE